jgi:hypothetical protein
MGVQLRDRPDTQPASVGDCALLVDSLPVRLLPPPPRPRPPRWPRALREEMSPGLRSYRRISPPRKEAAAFDFQSVAMRVSDPQTLAIGWNGSSRVGGSSGGAALVPSPISVPIGTLD